MTLPGVDAAPRSAVILGAGGHAKVIVEILRGARPDLRLVGVLGREPVGPPVLGLPVLGDDRELARLGREGVRCAFVAIGNNRLREQLCARLREEGFELLQAISPAAFISPSARLGGGVAVMAGAVIQAEAVLGEATIINTGATVDHDCLLGPAVHLGPGVAVAGEVQIGARALIGVGASVVPRVRIGHDTVVGAGACVTGDLPDAVLALGVPARISRHLLQT